MGDEYAISLDDEYRDMVDIGIIGGYGFTERMSDTREVTVETPYGDPSHPIIVGEMADTRVAFLSRHGRGRNTPSHTVNYRANLFSLYRVGVHRIVSATANGSLRAEIEIGDMAIPEDYIDRTKTRADTFFDGYPPRHFDALDPFCPALRGTVADAARSVGATPRTDDVTVVVPEGPRFATKAESKMYRQWGADIIGHSPYPEVALARELGICYVNYALITDYDVSDMVPENETVDVQTVDERLDEFNSLSRSVMEASVRAVPEHRCEHCSGHVEAATSDGDPAWEYRRPDL